MRYTSSEEWSKHPMDSIVPCNVYDADGILIDRRINSFNTETGEVVVQKGFDDAGDMIKGVEVYKAPLTFVTYRNMNMVKSQSKE